MKGVVKFATLLAATVFLVSCSKESKTVIGSIVFDENGEWFEEAIAGMRDAAKSLDVVLEERNSHYDLGVEKDLVNEHLKNKAKAIVICPLAEETGRVLLQAKTIGVPVITWNTVVSPEPTAQVVVDSVKLGSATADYLASYIERNNITGLKTALITNETYSVGVARCDGFINTIEPLIQKGAMEIVYETRSELTEETLVNVQKMLKERPDIEFIWCWNQTTLLATMSVLKELGRTDILVAGTDMSVSLAREMLAENGQLLAVTTQQPYKLGYEAVVNAVKAVKNEEIQFSIVIPTITYNKEDADSLKEYIKTHEKFERK